MTKHRGPLLIAASTNIHAALWSGHETMPDDKKAFYEFHACKMEPWDGPASMAFSDGPRIGDCQPRKGRFAAFDASVQSFDIRLRAPRVAQ